MRAHGPNFDGIARHYRVLEQLTLGRALERTRFHFLTALSAARRALVLGDGDGRFLAALLAENGTVHATAVDTSAGMLRLLRERCEPFADRLQMVQANALSFAEAGTESFDLVATHFFLDCLSQAELDALVKRVAPMLGPGALWVVSDFRIPKGAMRLPAWLLVRGLYVAFRLLTGLRATQLPDHAAALGGAGLVRVERRLRLAGVLTAELWRKMPNDTL